MDTNTAQNPFENPQYPPEAYFVSEHFFSEPHHVAEVLNALAAGENCDGEIYDAAVAAADYIHLLENNTQYWQKEWRFLLEKIHALEAGEEVYLNSLSQATHDRLAHVTLSADPKQPVPVITALYGLLNHADDYSPQDRREVIQCAELYIRFLQRQRSPSVENAVFEHLDDIWRLRQELRARTQELADIRAGLITQEGQMVGVKLLNYARAVGQMRRKIEQQKQEVARLHNAAAIKNRLLEAMHYVWGTHGYEQEAHRSTKDAYEQITVDVVNQAIENVEALADWYSMSQMRRFTHGEIPSKTNIRKHLGWVTRKTFERWQRMTTTYRLFLERKVDDLTKQLAASKQREEEHGSE